MGIPKTLVNPPQLLLLMLDTSMPRLSNKACVAVSTTAEKSRNGPVRSTISLNVVRSNA